MTQGFTLSSPAFGQGNHLPDAHTCEGEGVSPELVWSNPPPDVQSYALVMEDLDADDGARTNWLVFDIPGERGALAGNAHAVGRSGRNDRHHPGYAAPCPPPNQGYHRYRFRLHALDVATLNLPDGASRNAVDQAMQGHVLAQTDLTARCQRTTA